jgi:hypothetical protein
VVNVAAPNAPLSVDTRAVQTVALGEEVLQRPGTRVELLACGAIGGDEPGGRRSLMGTHARVVHLFAAYLAGHPGVEVGQPERGAGETDGNGVVGVEAEEPEARPALVRHVGTEVELREARQPRDSRQKAGPDALHAERHHAQPRRPLKGVEL